MPIVSLYCHPRHPITVTSKEQYIALLKSSAMYVRVHRKMASRINRLAEMSDIHTLLASTPDFRAGRDNHIRAQLIAEIAMLDIFLQYLSTSEGVASVSPGAKQFRVEPNQLQLTQRNYCSMWNRTQLEIKNFRRLFGEIEVQSFGIKKVYSYATSFSVNFTLKHRSANNIPGMRSLTDSYFNGRDALHDLPHQYKNRNIKKTHTGKSITVEYPMATEVLRNIPEIKTIIDHREAVDRLSGKSPRPSVLAREINHLLVELAKKGGDHHETSVNTAN